MGDPRAVGAQIRMKRPSPTPLEGNVVADMLARKDIDEAPPLCGIALKSPASEAMVVKVAKKLTFGGFRGFRQDHVNHYRSDTAILQDQIGAADMAGAIVQKVFRTAVQVFGEIFAILDLKAFDRAADNLGRAKRRGFCGLGGPAQFARDASHKFLRIGIRTSTFDGAHMMMPAALLWPDDVTIALSRSGATAAVLDAAGMARRNGARTIAVTKYPERPLARMVDLLLGSTAQNSPLLGENAPARIAQWNLLDALFVAVAQRDHKAADADLNRTMPAVPSKRRL